MASCPKFGNKLQGRRVLLLNNYSTVTCPACASKLQIKNKNVASLIGGGSAGIIVLLGTPLLWVWLQTRNVVDLTLFIALFAAVLFAASLIQVKYIKVEEKPGYQCALSAQISDQNGRGQNIRKSQKTCGKSEGRAFRPRNLQCHRRPWNLHGSSRLHWKG